MTFKIRDGLFATTNANTASVIFTTGVNCNILGMWLPDENRLSRWSFVKGTEDFKATDFNQALSLMS
jgi:hypothetical protein